MKAIGDPAGWVLFVDRATGDSIDGCAVAGEELKGTITYPFTCGMKLGGVTDSLPKR